MKRTHWLLVLLLTATAASLTGCAGGDPEDDAFFNRGWINPRERDSFGATPTTKPQTPAYYRDNVY